MDLDAAPDFTGRITHGLVTAGAIRRPHFHIPSTVAQALRKICKMARANDVVRIEIVVEHRGARADSINAVPLTRSTVGAVYDRVLSLKVGHRQIRGKTRGHRP